MWWLIICIKAMSVYIGGYFPVKKKKVFDRGVHRSDDLWEESAIVSGCFSGQCCASPTTLFKTRCVQRVMSLQ